MSEYSFIIDNMKFSFSNIGTFNNCPYSWKLLYIDYIERKSNWYAEYGSFIHLVLEKYFRGELELFELTDYFKDHYAEQVTATPPPFPANIVDTYFNDAIELFDNFDFDRNKYEVLFIEDSLETEYDGIKLVVKPDLVLRKKKTGEVVLYDYKTANPYKNGKADKKKIAEYTKQMYLYSFFIQKIKGFTIDKIRIWFVRINKFEEIKYDWAEAEQVIRWFYDQIEQIKAEEDFLANTKNKFFCSYLCSASDVCEFKS